MIRLHEKLYNLKCVNIVSITAYNVNGSGVHKLKCIPPENRIDAIPRFSRCARGVSTAEEIPLIFSQR